MQQPPQWACVDSNHGPLHYQCSALTTWATSPGLKFLKLLNILTELLNDTIPQNNQVSRKEVFQPHLPVRLPCYDLAPVASSTLNSALQQPSSGISNFHGLTGGVYKVRERIHRVIADTRLLAIPASWSRVADFNPNWDVLLEIGLPSLVRYPLYTPL